MQSPETGLGPQPRTLRTPALDPGLDRPITGDGPAPASSAPRESQRTGPGVGRGMPWSPSWWVVLRPVRVTVTLTGVIGAVDGDWLDRCEGDPARHRDHRCMDLVELAARGKVGLCILEGRLELVQPVSHALEVIACDQSFSGSETAALGQPAGLVGALTVTPPAVPGWAAWTPGGYERGATPRTACVPLGCRRAPRSARLRHSGESSRRPAWVRGMGSIG